ncbi:class VII unconventional myosin [Dictyostelium purpureum]|uniref:Class VII unconventional myosin n=1 Tax=Dictyostelium purpureum TaxID=5786 RepID=F0Z7K7_DICPU|nr:class VII unconventional myosin [Dictyostelium purpureum]EGC40078.1 class VII unconventional myosin [Dictyostelium purpureum]|eukprot:XP_003283427.1 class VII unconventional myosin [Dictyostelium purpureum]
MDGYLDEEYFNPVEDMITLPVLTEESLLLNLKLRYQKKQIYTYTGSILVAVNPYEILPIYTADIVKQYFAKPRTANTPHIFAVADAAYTNMMEEGKNQSLIISGESGAGKTESTKLIIQYLAARTNRHSQVEQMIVESSPILEAFGNAKTIRNNNSSRFGKFIEIQFNKEGHISGARIINYLLEKSRISHQADSERNYHIFYQLLAGADQELKEKLKLGEPEDYHYLNQSGCIRIDNINDVEDFEHVKYAMNVLGLPEDKQTTIFSIISAVLHLGNIQFEKSEKTQGAEGSEVSNKDSLKIVAQLLNVDPAKLESCLTIRHVLIRGQNFVIPLKVNEAEDTRDALSKALYGNVFNWLVTFINSRIHKPQKNSTFIGVLDIFGFENFKKNSFEQFCINFANEKLQQHFNQHIFKLEQEEYEKEKINWSKIVYNDNQECLDLIEKRPLGILSLLDEESRFPQATDLTYLEKLHVNHEKHPYYEKPRRSKTTFVVKHYAGEVAYDTSGFLDKNKDTVSDDLLGLLQGCKNKFIVDLFTPPKESGDDDDKQRGTKKTTAGMQFKTQLQSLINILSATQPHYVRCIKPNSTKEPSAFDHELIQAQLRYAGMMETIRIRKLGYPIRHGHKEFRDRYLILDYRARSADHRQTCAGLINLLNSAPGIDKEEWQLGHTKVFIRDKQYHQLEEMRKQKLLSRVVLIQSVWRMYRHKKRYQVLRNSAKLVETAMRSHVARREFFEQREAVQKIKGFFKMVEAQKRFKFLKENIAVIQNHCRSFVQRKETRNAVVLKRDRNKRMEEIQREKDEEERKRKEKEERERQEKEDQEKAVEDKKKFQEEQKRKEEELRSKREEEEQKKLEEKKNQLKELNQMDELSSIERMLKEQQDKNINELDNFVNSLEAFSFEGGVDDSQPYSYNHKMYEMSPDALDKISITDLLQGLKQTVRSVTKFEVDDSKFDLPPGIENVLKRIPPPQSTNKKPIQFTPEESTVENNEPVDDSSANITPESVESPIPSQSFTGLPPPPSFDLGDLPPPPTSSSFNDIGELPPPPSFDFDMIDPVLGLPPPPPAASSSEGTSGTSSPGASSTTGASSASPQITNPLTQELPELLQDEEISLYSFYEYANKNFNSEKLKQKEDIFSYQKSHIKSSLLVHADSEQTKLSVEIFSKVLHYMTSNPLLSKKDPSDFYSPVKFILTKGLSTETLRDEIYCQLIKQSTSNPIQDLNIRVWELIHFCCATFPPTRKLMKYFVSYLKSTIKQADVAKSIKDSAQSSYRVLQRFNLNGNRKQVPSVSELESIKECRPIFVRIIATDGSLKGLHIDSATTCSEASNDLSQRTRLRPNSKDNGFSILESFNGIERDIAPSDKICDVLSKVENLQATLSSKIQINFKLVFKKRLFFEEISSVPALESEFYVHQLYNDLFNPNFCKDQDLQITIGSLRLQAESFDYTDDIKNWLPGNGRGKYFTTEIEKTRFDDFIAKYKTHKGKSQDAAKKEMSDLLFKHPLANQSLLACEHQLEASPYPKQFVLALNTHGINIFDPATGKAIESVKYSTQSQNIKSTEKSFTIALENKQQLEIFTVDVSKGLSLIKEYSLFLKNNAKYARALRDYNVSDSTLLAFKRNDIITITFKDQENKWYIGSLNGKEGSFPVDHVEILLTDSPPPTPTLTIEKTPISGQSSSSSTPSSATPPMMSSPMMPPPPALNIENLPSLNGSGSNIPPPPALSSSPTMGMPPPPPLSSSPTMGMPPPPPMLSTPPSMPNTPPISRASIRMSVNPLSNSSDDQDDPSKRLTTTPALGSDSPLLQWASTRFRSFKRAATLNATATLKRKAPIDPNVALYFNKDTIKESLIESLDVKQSKKSVKNFSEIMMWMGDYPIPKGQTASSVIQSIVARGLENHELRDEIYCQAYRQTNRNPKIESTKKGFELIYFLAISFSPSDSLMQPFMEQLMSRNLAIQSAQPQLASIIAACIEKLESHPIASYQQRKKGPSASEIQSFRGSIDSGDISTCKIRFVDQSTKLAKISTYTTIREVTETVCKQYGISQQSIKMFGLCGVNETAGISKVLSESDMVYDVLTRWEQSEEKGEFYFQVRRRFFLDDVNKILEQEHLWTDDDISFELTFVQIRDEWMRGLHSTLNEKDSAVAAAILIQLLYPNQSKLIFTKEIIRQALPDNIIAQQNIKFWISTVESQIFELVSQTPEYLKLMFIHLVGTKSSIFGCTLFSIQQKENPPKAWLAINKKGISIFDPHTKESKHFWTFQSISNVAFTDDTFVIMTGNLMKPIKQTFTTDEHSSIASVYQFYSST